MKKLPIGKSDFKSIIQDNFYYIDKTNFISEVIDNSADVILLPRPRRFGKTLNLTMTKYFFDVEEDNRELFDNLNISKNQEAMKHCGKYPIIYITFKDVKESSFEYSYEKIKRLISNEFKRHSKAIMNLDIDEIDKKEFKRLSMRKHQELIIIMVLSFSHLF